MLRISCIENGAGPITLRLEGRVAGPWVAELLEACEKVLGEGRRLALDLAEVSFLDPAGAVLLGKVRSRGVQLLQCSPFLKEQLKGTFEETKEAPNRAPRSEQRISAGN